MSADARPQYRGLTWDHPRGTHALRAAAQRAANQADPLSIEWDAQPLEGFESAPIAELAAQYDLLVIDHPHLGDAIYSGALQPLDDLFPETVLQDVLTNSVGVSAETYVAENRTWALPLDAATQVAAVRKDLLADPPSTWAEVVALSAKSSRSRVALSLAGPHAFLSLCSLTAALGHAPRSLPPRPSLTELTDDAAPLFDRATALEAFDMMHTIASRAPHDSKTLNPIGLLDRMRDTDDIAYIPLVYGYVNYSTTAGTGASVNFVDAPSALPGGPPVGTIGGTGIAVSSRAEVTPALIAHLTWLLSPEAQVTWIPEHEGQPSRDSAWESDLVNKRSANFYRETRRTMEASWMRPRFAGFTPFQSEASALVRAGLGEPATNFTHTIDRIEFAYRKAREHAADLLSTGVQQ